MVRKVVFALPLIAGGILLAGCQRSQSGSSGSTEVTVRVVEVSTSENAGNNLYLGNVQSGRSTNILSTVPGTVKSLNVRKGQMVRKGDIVATISSEAVQSSLDIASAALSQAEDGYSRMMQLYEKGGVTEVKKKEVETQLKTARASYNTARKATEGCTVKAPFSGCVEETFTETGVDVALFAPLARIIDERQLEIHFKVPEGDVSSLEKGSDLSIEIPALGRTVSGKLDVIDAGGNLLSHAYDCISYVGDEIDGLKPSMAVKVRCSSGSGSHVISIPSSALFTDMDGRYVWVVENGMVEKRKVNTGGYTDKGIIVTEGIEVGDLVIVEGARKVCSSMKVRTVR